MFCPSLSFVLCTPNAFFCHLHKCACDSRGEGGELDASREQSDSGRWLVPLAAPDNAR
jgi:hypothetical protein